ncbi:MAG TPA: hypothetical protein VG476_13970 [Acidimicrobiales bacterium]|nr:hypothetical protein [Acidimicrobiales bacterium]
MSGQVQHFVGPEPDDGDPIPPADLWRNAVEEYRFQAGYNWSRTQYLFVFNAGILTAAVVTAHTSGTAAIAVFALGIVAAIVTIGVVRTQHGYYRAARDRLRRVEEMVQIPAGARTDATATLGGRPRRISVNEFVQLLCRSTDTSRRGG